MQQIANRYSTDTEYMFPIITKEGNADIIDQITQSRHNIIMYNLRSVGKQYKFSVSPTIAMTKDLWRKIMDKGRFHRLSTIDFCKNRLHRK